MHAQNCWDALFFLPECQYDDVMRLLFTFISTWHILACNFFFENVGMMTLWGFRLLFHRVLHDINVSDKMHPYKVSLKFTEINHITLTECRPLTVVGVLINSRTKSPLDLLNIWDLEWLFLESIKPQDPAWCRTKQVCREV